MSTQYSDISNPQDLNLGVPGFRYSASPSWLRSFIASFPKKIRLSTTH
jgi:hypothetical protein